MTVSDIECVAERDTYLLIVLFVAVVLLALVSLLAARMLARRVVPTEPGSVPRGAVAVVLMPGPLCEIAHGLEERLDHLKRMNAARPTSYFLTAIEHAQDAVDAIAEARERDG